MQIIIEGLALAAFNVARQGTNDPVFKDMLYLIIRDEARHVTFGVNYLEEFIARLLSKEELEERAMFAYEACLVMRGRLMSLMFMRILVGIKKTPKLLLKRLMSPIIFNIYYLQE